ncbi:MAG TPA: polysaccharide deacetylase family protein, partial [Blastocatellia bacterium]|nr:polysaccharide deacetylase family protein [Blastocatellia bacterium]
MVDKLSLIGKRSLKSIAAPLLRNLPITRYRFKQGSSKPVLLLAYHRVVKDIALAEKESINGLVISTKSFENHLEIVRETYDIVSFDEAIECLKGNKTMNRGVAAITFDDAYRDVYDHAWPVLKKLGLPAIVYVPTALVMNSGLLDHDRLYWLVLKAREKNIDLSAQLTKAGISLERKSGHSASHSILHTVDTLYYQTTQVRKQVMQCLEEAIKPEKVKYPESVQLMTWKMVREMFAEGITFGAHSEHHPVLTLESTQFAEREILGSKRELQDQLGAEVRHFAYPNGCYNQSVKQLVAAAGFETS